MKDSFDVPSAANVNLGWYVTPKFESLLQSRGKKGDEKHTSVQLQQSGHAIGRVCMQTSLAIALPIFTCSSPQHSDGMLDHTIY